MTTVIVGGALANKPDSGGEAWVRLSWADGLRRLGFDVWLVEQIEPASCVDAGGQAVPFEHSRNRAYFAQVVGDCGWENRASLVCLGEPRQVEGVDWETVTSAVADAALVVNISGHLREPALLRPARARAYVDIDPGFTQIWHEEGGDLGLEDHDHFFTIGVNIGRPACLIPTGGLAWRPIHQPVVLDSWPVVPCHQRDRFTTIGNWRGPYGPISHHGRSYGTKVHEFRKIAALPRAVPARFDAALAIHDADDPDRLLLEQGGWHLADPAAVAHPAEFRNFIQGSGAEVSAAQGVYVETVSGWFSDRSVRYLASGRPVLVQATGFSSTIPIGQGIVAFSDLEGAAAGAVGILREWDAHAQAARAVAEGSFAHDVVLPPLLEACGLT